MPNFMEICFFLRKNLFTKLRAQYHCKQTYNYRPCADYLCTYLVNKSDIFDSDRFFVAKPSADDVSLEEFGGMKHRKQLLVLKSG